MSALIVWKDEQFCTGIKSIDEQHRKLVDLVNHLHDVSIRKQFDVLDDVFFQVMDYVHYHFQHEEELMKKAKFSELEAHQIHHQAFIKKISELHHAYRGTPNDSELTGKLLTDYLALWIHKHILVEDREYIFPIRNHGLD